MERDTIKGIKALFESYERFGPVLWFDRLNTGKVQTKYGSWLQLCRPGTPDMIALVKNKEGGITVLFIEAKAKTGAQRDVQREWETFYASRHRNIMYLLAKDANYVNSAIKSISHCGIDSIEYNP